MKINPIIYAHEHTAIDLSGMKHDIDCKLDNRAAVVEEYQGLARRGVRLIVDQTNRGMGRDVLYTEGVASEAGLRVLHATGYYKEPFLPPECYEMDEDALARLMCSELEQGIEDTSIKAAFIGEIGTSKGAIQPMEEKIFRAASRAHEQTGAPICTHTTLGTLGLEQIAIFRGYKVDLSRVVLSHIDLSADVDYMLRLLDSGVNIAFDTVGKNNYQPDADRVRWLSMLCGRGYSGQIVMSVDITRRSHYKNNGGIGYAYLLDTFVPMLEEAGIPEKDLQNLLYGTAARVYGYHGA